MVRSATDRAYQNGLWTGRVEAVTVAGLAAYAYHSWDSRVEGEEGEDGWREEGEDGEDGWREEGRVDYGRELFETRELMSELKAQLARVDDPLVAAIERPPSGAYVGESAEDDDGDQAVSTKLTFGLDGSIVGEGHDGVDGDYAIREGRWAAKRVAWIETYDEGFSVALRGQVRPDGSILALWASSRGVGGSVELRAPKMRNLGGPQ